MQTRTHTHTHTYRALNAFTTASIDQKRVRACSPLRVRACGEDTGVKKKGTKEKKSDREGSIAERRRGQQGRWVGRVSRRRERMNKRRRKEEKNRMGVEELKRRSS